MDLREVELGPISEVEIDRDQAELGATSSQAELKSQSDFGNWLFPLLNQRTFSNIYNRSVYAVNLQRS